MKKIFSLFLVAVFAMVSMISTAFAATPVGAGTSETTTGKITIGSPKTGETYKIYRIMDLESYDKTKSAYSYKASSNWAGFFETSEAQSYFDVNDQGYITLKAGVENNETTAKAIASAALAYAQANSIAPTDSATAAEGSEVVFDDIALGYYLVESSVGIVLSLNTTDNVVTINEKNTEIPVIEKTIGEGKLTITNGSIGDSVPYTITLKNIAGKKNVLAHDTLSVGLTFNDDIIVNLNGREIATENYTITKPGTNGETFTVKLSDAYVKTLASSDIITIVYSATINQNSVTAIANTNTAKLTYGNNQSTEEVTTETYTYGFKIHKTDGTEALEGAEFKLYDAKTAGNEIKVVFVKTESGVNFYRVATQREATNAVTISAGKAQIDGLAEGTYYLEETKAPTGYNKLAARVQANVVASTSETQFSYEDGEIINTTGTVLPSTGGVGTVLFITIGSLLVMATGVALITKFRMAKEI